MPTYKPLPENDKVVDVLCCLVLKHNRVKEIMKVLKQPHSTVSEKLRFLMKNNVVKKDKWEFSVNWPALLSLLREILESNISKTLYKKYAKLFDDNRLKDIMESYAKMVNEFKNLHETPKSLEGMIKMYLLGLMQMNSNELKTIDKRFLQLKKDFGAMSEEKYLFIISEK